ncbi:oxidoreductase domain protein [Haloterrigena salina JCM 13891]|uniref:Oxidoreductase domain protein n=2 Tax=Haloterrigena salina TaxID=504937 RepID=M0C1F8_9EURY|nr:oxidoreductase domain protein [Haloterrigena salina JCM 13891]
MGENHARVYSELQDVELACVADHDEEVARRVADAYATDAVAFETVLERCDVVTVAVPTRAHYDVVSDCLNADVHVLVEKPIAETTEQGRALAELAEERGLVLQVGHIERFNPAVQTVTDLLEDLDVISVEAERLGPPLDRTALGNVVFDLMVHDLDIVASLLEDRPDSVTATGTESGQYATATLEFDDVVASLTASRVTQKKVRTLTVTARECLVEVDYLEQSVLIHRDSYPEYLTDDGKRRYRHESVVERPRVDNGEPLRHELESFVEAARNDSEPVVTAEDGIRALEMVQTIDSLVTEETEKREVEA